MIRPGFHDNRAGNTLRAALDEPAPQRKGLAEAQSMLAEVAIATGLVTPAGFAAITPRLENAAWTRLLLGAEATPEAHRIARGEERRPGETPLAHERRAVADGLRHLDTALRHERDRLPFTMQAQEQRQRMVAMLRDGRIETRRHESVCLPAKALLLDGLAPGLVVGSSNLTETGLDHDGALNLAQTDRAVFAQARAWFDALWGQAVPFDLAAIFAEPDIEYPPWLIFLRMLFQLYGDELAEEVAEAGEIPLTAFQLHGVWRARRILKEYGGVIVADEVGLGKTFIAGEILNAAAKLKQRALLICPAALRDSTWTHFLETYGISRYVEMVSFDQLARDRQLHDERRPLATQDVLKHDIDLYALIVVDEAHNYRNPDAPYRAGALRRLLFGSGKQLVLLTATPVNNSLYDLYYLMRFFLRQDGALAPRGIASVHGRFKEAAKQDPSELNPDLLYPVIDAVTVKRTRAFVKRFYADATLRGPDGTPRPIVFPKAVPLSLRYDLDAAAPGLFDAVADALDPAQGRDVVRFARYAPDAFRRDRDADEAEAAEATGGLLRSGLLKRFESSAHAFRRSLDRMVREHDAFLAALDRGKVVGTGFLRELAADDDAFDDLLAGNGDTQDAAPYDAPALATAVARDRAILHRLAEQVAGVAPERDPKLATLVEALAAIAADARHDSATDAEERRNRKVLVFSYFADTVAWLREALDRHVAMDARLAGYRGRIVAVAGGGLAGEDAGRDRAVWGFAPETADPPPGRTDDLYDLLIATDVLAEGLNLQQCRNIVNYDLPWNPMRLVQRHGRIDRIGSPHRRVFLRTIFPADRLDALLELEARNLRKLAQAARSIGVATLPLHGAEPGVQVFAETRAAIERLAAGDGTLFDQGGTPGAIQSGEEYRQRLRAALSEDRAAIELLPGGAGSGLRRGRATGVLFCAEVALREGRRSFLRFVPAGPDWRPGDGRIERETATCLRVADCERDATRAMPSALADGVFAFWLKARESILEEWDDLTDPAFLQPVVRLLNRQVAAFLRSRSWPDVAPQKLARALDVLESPWPMREETMLRERFRDRAAAPALRGRALVDWVLSTGLEPAHPPAPLPPIESDAVRLVCWMALAAAPS